MRMRGLKFFFLLLIFTLGTVSESQAMVTRRITIPNLRFTSPQTGQAYRVNSQTISTRCDSSHCYFRAGDYRIKVRIEDVEVLTEYRTVNPTYFTPNVHTGGSDELSGDYEGNHTDGYVSRRYTGDGSSEHLECYQRLRDSYTSRHCPSDAVPSVPGNQVYNIHQCRGEGTKSRSDSIGWCARYVRFILSDCGVLPDGHIHQFAERGGPALESQGFERLSTTDPSQAPLGSIIIYSGTCPAAPANADPGHIEIKTGPNEYTSDYVSTSARSTQTSCRRVSGIYFK